LLMSLLAASANVQRVAECNTLTNRFVLGWREAYEAYHAITGVSPVEESDVELCEEDLLTRFASAGIDPPPGRARGAEHLQFYLAPDGLQRQIEVCFMFVDDWFVGLDEDELPVHEGVHVLRLSNLSSDLARKLDAAIDGYADAAWGDFRSQDAHADEVPASWPDLYVDDELASVNTYWRMTH